MTRIYLYVTGIMSLLTFLIFGIDKLLSKKESNPRIPEVVLLGFSAFGGALGGILGRYLFRHKTVFRTKFHFSIGVWFSFIVQAAILVYIVLIERGII